MRGLDPRVQGRRGRGSHRRRRLDARLEAGHDGRSALPSTARWRRLLRYAPDFQIVFLVVVAGDESVLVAPLGMNVLFRHQERRLHEAARGRAMKGAIELVDRLVGLKLDRLGNGDFLVLAALANAIVGRAVAVGADQLDLTWVDAARP